MKKRTIFEFDDEVREHHYRIGGTERELQEYGQAQHDQKINKRTLRVDKDLQNQLDSNDTNDIEEAELLEDEQK